MSTSSTDSPTVTIDGARPGKTSPASGRVNLVVPASRWPILDLRELWEMRRVLYVLAERTLKVRYQQTAIGIAWVLLQPLILVVIVSVFMGLILDRGQRYALPYPVFLFTAWVAWRTFSKVVSEAGKVIMSNGAIVERIYLPRLYIPASLALASVVDLVFLIVALLVMLVAYGIAPGIGLLSVPFALVILYVTIMGVSLFLSAATLRYRDMDIVTPLLVQALFWISPVVYPSAIIPPAYQAFYYLNPLAVVIDSLRWGFTRTPAPPPEAWVIGSSVAVLLLVLGYVYFRRNEPTFADYL